MLRKKRILIFNWWDIKNPKAGGAEVHLNEIFSRLVKKGFDVTLLCSKFQNSKSCEKINGIRVLRKGLIYTINIISFFWYLKNKKNFDLVIEYTNKIPYLTPLYLRKKPLIAIAHHVFGEIWLKEWGFIGRFFKYFERLFYRIYRDTLIIAVSKSTKEELVDIGLQAKNIQVIYNGISVPLEAGIKNHKPLIVYLGRLKKYKRIDLILEIMPAVIRIYPDIQLIIMGRGNDDSRLKKIVIKKKIQSNVKFLGFVSESLKLVNLRKAWLNIQPSIKEGWGLTVVEAAACGTPTIASNVPGLKDSILDEKTGWLFKKNNIKQLKNLIIEVLINKEKREKAGQEAIKFAKGFNWSKSAHEFQRLIDKV